MEQLWLGLSHSGMLHLTYRLDSQAPTEFPLMVDQTEVATMHSCGDNPKDSDTGSSMITDLLSGRVKRLREETSSRPPAMKRRTGSRSELPLYAHPVAKGVWAQWVY